MFNFSNWSLKAKLTSMAAAVVLSITGGSLYFQKKLADNGKEKISESLKSAAIALGDAIEAQLYERYGDVQAFASNPGIQAKTRSEIVEHLNNYAVLYGIYDLILVVDKSGHLIAVNDKSPTGNKLEVDTLYKKNYANELWFQATIKGEFTQDKAQNFDGTYIENTLFDPLVAEIYKTDGFGSGFSAQVKNAKGEVIGVVSNRAGIRWIENELQLSYKKMEGMGFISTELTLLDKDGNVALEYDPHFWGKPEPKHDNTILGKRNLNSDSYPDAKEALSGKDGYLVRQNPIKNIKQLVGYSKIQGPKIPSSFAWYTLVQDDATEIFSEINQLTYAALGSSLLISILTGLFFLTFARKISLTVTQISTELSNTAHEALNLAKQLTSVSAQLSDGANEQASAIQETASSIHEVSSMVKRNAENSQKSQDTAAESRQAAETGKEATHDVIKSIDGISQSQSSIMNHVQESNTQLEEIVKVISEIGTKTKVINDIVFQTKLLSFNASVEAARAGEHGKGFAVVAEEVGNLASMSGNAAKEISSMLDGSIQRVETIVRDTRSRVDGLVREAKERVDSGTDTAKRCEGSLEQIFGLAQKVDTMVAEISAASREQEQGVTEINHAISQLDTATQKTAQLSNESATAAQQLTSQSEELNELVKRLQSVIDGSSGNAGFITQPTHAATTPSKKKTVHQPKNKKAKTGPVEAPTAKPNLKLIKGEKQPAPSFTPTNTDESSHIVHQAVGADSVPSEADPRFEDV